VYLGQTISVHHQLSNCLLGRMRPNLGSVRDVACRLSFGAKLAGDFDFDPFHGDGALRRLSVNVIAVTRR
jgi:hypothetical protein